MQSGRDGQAVTGLYSEFVSSGRLDNLVGTYGCVWALADSVGGDSQGADPHIRIAVCFDNEECGSQSAQGAMSSVLEWLLRRFHGDRFEASVPRSLLLSADQAHACHPNYALKHEPNHKVSI